MLLTLHFRFSMFRLPKFYRFSFHYFTGNKLNSFYIFFMPYLFNQRFHTNFRHSFHSNTIVKDLPHPNFQTFLTLSLSTICPEMISSPLPDSGFFSLFSTFSSATFTMAFVLTS